MNRRKVSFDEAIAKVVAIKERDAQRAAMFGELVGLLEVFLEKDQLETCRHEETHRGGVIWTICDQCGKEWADDQGGKPEFVYPETWTKAEKLLAKAKELK